jgi:glycosyltransferase involved in cell wall biosynthesis
MLANLGDTWVITRANNRAAIEAGLEGLPERDRIHFAYVDLPGWARFWKRGQRGVRLYYILWQACALRTGRRLHRQLDFDLTWHVTMANAWLGSLAPLVGPPFVYGPVGGALAPPRSLIRELGWAGGCRELARATARGLGRALNPLARIAWRRARLILVQNSETRDWLPARHAPKAVVFPNVVLDEHLAPARLRRRGGRSALFVGRLLSFKGASMAVRTLPALPGWRLLVAGAGPDQKRLTRIALRLGIEDRVQFLGWVGRPEILRLMSEEADVLLFPSLREDAGWVVAEAAACGLPVVSLDRGGPRVLGAVGVAPRGRDATVAGLAAAVTVARDGTPPPVPQFAASLRRLASLLEASGCASAPAPALKGTGEEAPFDFGDPPA